MIRPTSRKSSSSKPRIVAAGVPMRTPGGDGRRALVERHGVPVHGQLDLVQPLLGVLAGPVRLAQVELEQMRVGAAREHVEAGGHQLVGERVGVRTHLLLVGAERLGGRRS